MTETSKKRLSSIQHSWKLTFKSTSVRPAVQYSHILHCVAMVLNLMQKLRSVSESKTMSKCSTIGGILYIRQINFGIVFK